LPINEIHPSVIREGGKALRLVRTQAGLSQTELSRLSGVYRNHISKMERGINGAANQSRLGYNASAVKLARTLKTKPAAIWPMYLAVFAATKRDLDLRRREAIARSNAFRARIASRENKRRRVGRLEKKLRATLSDNQRNTARLYAEGMSLTQIAKRNGISKQAVYSTLSAILARKD